VEYSPAIYSVGWHCCWFVPQAMCQSQTQTAAQRRCHNGSNNLILHKVMPTTESLGTINHKQLIYIVFIDT
jgi:hypothetical protein